MHNPLTRELLYEHYQNPVNNSRPKEFDFEYSLSNRTCGDEITVFVSIDKDKITKIHYEIIGCGLSVASASILSEELAGKTFAEIEKLDQIDLEAILGEKLSISRIKCAIMPLRAIQDALALSGRD